MTRSYFGSGDFALVPGVPTADLSDRLLHRDVADTGAPQDRAFSDQRRHFVRTVDLPSRVLSVTIGGLNPGQSTRKHRHNYETIIYVLSGCGASVIEGREIEWKAGDAFYVPVWAWHHHINKSQTESARYLACENAPLLQNLGIAVREEA